jgi:hypothetical protein
MIQFSLSYNSSQIFYDVMCVNLRQYASKCVVNNHVNCLWNICKCVASYLFLNNLLLEIRHIFRKAKKSTKAHLLTCWQFQFLHVFFALRLWNLQWLTKPNQYFPKCNVETSYRKGMCKHILNFFKNPIKFLSNVFTSNGEHNCCFCSWHFITNGGLQFHWIATIVRVWIQSRLICV